MVTGDNPYTAINVSIQCGILEKGRIYLGALNADDILWEEIQDQKSDINEDRSCNSLDNLSKHQLTTQEILKLTIRY